MKQANPVVVPEPFEMTTIEAKIVELAELSLLDYETQRVAAAKSLGLRVSVLDSSVEKKRKKDAPTQTDDSLFPVVEPWPEPVDGGDLLAELCKTFDRYCILPKNAKEVIAAWGLHAWAHDAADVSPILALVSPEKRCGKTTTLNVLGALVPRPLQTSNITTAVLFRAIEAFSPTVLIDEADTYLKGNDELRGILNAGHVQQGALVLRCVGDNHEPTGFPVWAPKVIAMIGKLPDTLEDRSLVIRLRRKHAAEKVERFRAGSMDEFDEFRRRATRWVQDNSDELQMAEPHVPDALNDRAQDNARALCAIADNAGGTWPQDIRNAIVDLASQSDDDPVSAGVRLLKDIVGIIASTNDKLIPSAKLCNALCAIEEAPWGEWRAGQPITTRGIAKLLKPFSVKPRRSNAGSYYLFDDFADPIARYVDVAATESATSATTEPSATKKINEINELGQNGSSDTCGAVAEHNSHVQPIGEMTDFNF